MNHNSSGELAAASQAAASQARNAYRVSLIGAVAAVVAFAVYLGIAIQYGAWQLHAFAGSILVIGLSAVVSLAMTKRGRASRGIELTIGSVLFASLVSVAVTEGMGLASAVSVVAITMAVGGYTLPPRRTTRAIIWAALVACLVFVYDLYGPAGRLPVPGLLVQIISAISVVFVAGVGWPVVRRFRTYTLRTKLILTFLAVALLPTILLGMLNVRNTRTTLTRAANSALFGAAEQAARSLDSFIAANLTAVSTEAQLVDFVSFIGQDPQVLQRNAELREEAMASLQVLARKDPGHILSYALLDKTLGSVMLDTASSVPGAAEGDKDYFLQVRASHAPFVAPAEVAPDGTASFVISAPIQNSEGELLGVLRVRYNARVLQDLITQSSGAAGADSYAFLLDENGFRIADGKRPDLVFTSTAWLAGERLSELQGQGRVPRAPMERLYNNLPDLERVLSTAQSQPATFTAAAYPGEGLSQAAVSGLKTRPWRVVYVQPHAAFLHPVEQQTRLNRLLALIGGAVVAVVAVGLAGVLAAPIKRLTDVAEQVRAGDLNAQARVESPDEIGALASTFNSMTARLRQTFEDWEHQLAEQTQALRESEQLFRRLFSASPDAIVLLDPHHPAVSWPIVDCNEAACQMNGYTREELIGQSVDILNTTVGPPEERAAYLESLRWAGVIHLETLHRRKDGGVFPIEVSTSVVTVAGRELILGIDRDITERKQLEAALRDSEQRFRSLFVASPDAIFLLDPGNSQAGWIIVDCNETACRMNGYSREELIGQTIDLFNRTRMRPEEFEAALENLRHEGVVHAEALHRHKRGHLFPVDYSSSLIMVGGREMVLGIDRDITERKQFESALRDSEERFRSLFDASPDAIFLIDAGDPQLGLVIVDCNQAACRMNGYTRQELIGQINDLLNVPPTPPERRAAYLQDLRREGVAQGEAYHRHKDGHIFPIEYSMTFIIAGGRELILGIDRDITERKQAEEALRESEQRFRWLFTASPDAIFLLDPHHPEVSWPILDCNQAACRMNGYTREELIGQPIDVLNVTEGKREDHAAHLESLRRAGVVLATEALHRHKDGHLFPIEYSSSIITVGERELVLSVDRDITERRQADAALRLSEERFQLVTHATNDAVWDLNLRTGQRWWNAGIRSRYGYAHDQVGADQAWWEARIHPEDRAKVLESLRNALAADGQFWSKEYRFSRSDGTYAYVFDRGYVMQDEAGQPVRIIGAMLDLTERKRTEEALRQSEELFSKAFHASPAPMSIVRVDAGEYVDVNDSWGRLFGWGRNETIGRTVFDLNVYVDRHDRSGILGRVQEQGLIRDHEITIRVKSGKLRDILLSAQFVEIHGQICLLSTYFDITERRQFETALRQSEERFRHLFDFSPDAIFLLDPHDCESGWPIVDCNTAACRMNGYARDELIGQWIDVLNLTPGTPEERVAYLERLRHEGAVHEAQIMHRHKDGHLFPIEYSISIITVGDRELILGIDRDITERKRAEESQRELNQKLTRSLGELEQRNSEIELLNRMGDLLQACSTVEEAYTVIGEQARQLFGDDSGGIYVVSPSRDLVEAAALWGPAGDESPGDRIFAPNDCWAWRRVRMHLAGAGSAAPTCRHYARVEGGAHLCLPLMAPDGALGLLHLHHPTAAVQAAFSQARQRLAQAACDTVALALANLNLRQTLRNQSIRDPLTDLFNRRYMEESLERELARAVRSSYPIGIIMLDIDHFKHFNDTFGHAGGDLMLRELGAWLKAHIRGGDVACRYGGEEFTIILPEATLAITRQRAEELRQEVKRIQVRYHDQTLGSITISLGVAAFPDHGLTSDLLLRAADKALYRAKNTGRDRVVVAG